MDMIRVIVNRSLALREGLDETRALTLGMMGAMIGPPVTGYIVTMALARREAPAPEPEPVPPTPGDRIETGDLAAVGGDAARRARDGVRARDKQHADSAVAATPVSAHADTLGTASSKAQPAG